MRTWANEHKPKAGRGQRRLDRGEDEKIGKTRSVQMEWGRGKLRTRPGGPYMYSTGTRWRGGPAGLGSCPCQLQSDVTAGAPPVPLRRAETGELPTHTVPSLPGRGGFRTAAEPLSDHISLQLSPVFTPQAHAATLPTGYLDARYLPRGAQITASDGPPKPERTCRKPSESWERARAPRELVP